MRALRAVLLLCLVAGGATLQPARKTPPRKSPPRRPRYAELEAKSAARWQRFRAGDAAMGAARVNACAATLASGCAAVWLVSSVAGTAAAHTFAIDDSVELARVALPEYAAVACACRSWLDGLARRLLARSRLHK